MDNNYRNKYLNEKLIISYNDTIKNLDNAYKNSSNNEEAFLINAVKIYNRGIIYKWDKKYTQIPITKNYILYLLSFIDKRFLVFESSYYETALGRGFGICSQNAIGLADLLYRRYNIKTYMVGLSGHVVLTTNVNNSKVILDPSVGLYIPYPLNKLENNISIVEAYYSVTTHPKLAETYNKRGNHISKIVGGGGNIQC